MKPLSPYARRILGRWSGRAIVILFCIGLYLAYRWAEPSPAALNGPHNTAGGGVTLRLQNAPFAGYINGVRAWSLRAGQVDIERLPNTTLSSIQNATLTKITDGLLYEPTNGPGRTGVVASSERTMEADNPDHNRRYAVASFHAGEGRYSLGALETLAPDLQMSYNLLWQFRLSGGVTFRTKAGDQIDAPSMTIYNLINKRTTKPEQRIVCDEGAKMSHGTMQVAANRIRFNPKDRTVECLTGVRGTFSQGSVQAERVFWSMADETLRCPEIATGVVEGMPFTATGLTLDLKHRVHHANHIRLQLRMDNQKLSDSILSGR